MGSCRRPSEYIRERSLTMEERIKEASHVNSSSSSSYKPKIVELVGGDDLSSTTTKVSDIPLDKPLFQAYPSEIILQSYEAFQTYEITISFRNNDKFARKLKLEPINHPHFVVTGMKNESLQSGKVAPGMEVQFLLRFTPEENIDYAYNLVCVTEREKFLLPIRAYGARGVLDFPDSVSFADCPVRFANTKTLFIRNIGNRSTKFNIEVEEPFSASPSSGCLDVKKNMQIDIVFNPESVGSYEKNMYVKYDSGETLKISLIGNAEDANIRLEKGNLKLDSTYITLSSAKSLRLYNRSDIMVNFKWKMFSTHAEDRQYRLRKKIDLDTLEAIECTKFFSDLSTTQGLDLCDLAPLYQKYKNKRREIENNPLLFESDVFFIQPAGVNTGALYCEVSGRQNRLPLLLKGEGIGPKARFSYDLLDISEVFINTNHQYEVIIENRGEIDFHYSLVKPNSLFGPKFQFFPESGCLKRGEQQLIRIQFNCDILGTFSEEFMWDLEGSPDKLSLCCKGNVVGPTFYFNSPSLDFGKLAYGFLSERTTTIVNTSHIPMTFVLRIPSEEQEQRSEFFVTPQRGTIPPMGTAQVKLEFTPRSIKRYEDYLSVDVDSVGEDLLRLPILAESLVPEISLRTPILDYSDCFLSYPYSRNAQLVNETDFPARYELLSQEETAKNVYSYASKNGTGIIMPHSSVELSIDVQLKRLGQINFPIFIKIFGIEDMPLGIDISANGIGPNVLLSTTELNWGKIQVLKENVSTLTLTNDSPISANFTCATVSDSSVFKVEPQFGTIAPGASVNIDVTAYLDDTLKFTDILKIGIQSDGIHEVQLVARGQGTTITFDESLRNVDFQDVFSNRECSREFVLINKGRRAQTLHWSADEDRFARKDLNAAANQVFEVIPTRFSLKPNGQQVIVVKGYSNKALKCKETLICQGTIDKDPTRKVVVEMTVSANFTNPLLEMVPPILKFVSAHTRDEDFELLSQNLSLKNTSPLPLHLSFRCPIPYSVEPNEVDHRLNQGDSVTVTVHYDPKYNTNRVSCKEHAKLWITYSEHPQKDFIELFSEITFPNLTFTTNSLSFGCVPNDMEQRKTLQMTNSSSLPVEYSWSFLEGSARVTGTSSPVSIHEVFDIQPTRSILYPNETEAVDVTFFGHTGGLYSVTALCDVVGGPKYEVTLKGESSYIEYTFDKQVLDFGVQPYQDILEQELVLSNTGQVTFDYTTIIFPNSPLAQRIMVSPSAGTISPHGKQKISVRYCPSVPETIDDCFFIQLALFEPIKIRVLGTGIFPHFQMNIPRMPDTEYDAIFNETKAAMLKSSVSKSKQKLLTDRDAAMEDVESPQEHEIEAEAERLLLSARTLAFLNKMSEELKSKIVIPPKTRVQGSPILIFKSQQKVSKEKKAVANIFECSQVSLANYVCNFGNVIRNTSRKKSFKLTNHGLSPISFQLDKSVLVGTGFSIEPDRVKLLPGQPYCESIEFQVAFQARSQNVGAIEVQLPINIQGGPTTTLTLRADVTLPDLQLSCNEVDFAEVLCGHRKTITIQLQNKNTVPCEWTSHGQEQPAPATNPVPQKTSVPPTKKKSGGLSMKEFELVPSSGTLQPGEKVLLMIKFSPTDEKEYDVVVPIKVNMNSQLTPLRLVGRGFKPQIVFEPEVLNLAPILPCSEGTEAKFCIYNPTNYPVEIYSLEFDQVYHEEEEILRNADGYDGNALYLPPREPGQGLPDYIVQSAQQRLKQKLQLLAAVADNAPGKPSIANSEAGGVGDLIDTSRTNKPSDSMSEQPLNVILHGAPFSGRTTQARRIAKSFGIIYIRVDDLIDSVLNSENSTQDKGRELLLRLNTDGIDDRPAIRRSSALPEDSKSAKEEHYDQFDDHRFISEDGIFEILKARLQRDDCRPGVVIDSLESKYVPNPVSLLKLILRALGEKKKAVFIHLALDTAHIKERELNVLKTSGEVEDPLNVKEISEEEYDNMTEAEREHHDALMMKYKKRAKELQDKRKQERKHWEEEMAVKVGERKAEEENVKVKKKLQRRTASRQGQQGEKYEKPNSSAPKSDNKAAASKTAGQERNTLSPRVGRKLPGDKAIDKDAKSEKGDRADMEEYSSRFTLSDAGDIFVNDTTYRRMETYTATLDSILLIVRDGEKPSAGRQIPNSASPDKKAAKGGKSTATAVDGNASALPTDSDTHPIEDNNGVVYREVNGVSDEPLVFKLIMDHLPSNPKLDEAPAPEDVLPPPFLEQIVYLPSEREPQSPPRYFQLLPPTLNSESNDDDASVSHDPMSKNESATLPGPQGNVVNPTGVTSHTASPAVPAGSTSTGATSSGPASNKKHRPVILKITEDSKPIDLDEEYEKEPLPKYRWIIQPKERKELTVKFSTNEIGKFEQVLQFEIMGSRAKYSILCVGHCRYSQIVNDYKKIFPKWKKVKEERHISHGEYIASTGIFEFGPLLYSKPREKYLEKFPENKAVFVMTNSSPQEIKLAFALKNDIKSDVFFFDPPTMDLAPGQSQNFTLWAYPRSANYFEDTLVICGKDNPEPYCYKISCIGCKPELEIDKRQLSFDKLLLGRSEKREIKLKNNTFMPVAWKLAQVELLGDEFTVTPLEGIIEPFQDQAVIAEFKGLKPVVISRRSIRLEVSDTEKIGGVVQEVPIVVTAEAYDIAMDLHFPKGYEGGLDFGVLKVLEEGKQMCTLKNKGKYEVGFRFLFENKDLSEILSIIPQQGIMQPSDKPFAVQVILKANREMVIRDSGNLKCQCYEPTTGEVTATIPVKLLARAVFSRFSILPVRDLNFGALVHGTKATRQFTVENQGEFDFRYSIYKIIQGTNEVKANGKLRTNSRASRVGRPSSPPPQKVMNRKELVKQADAANFGAFTVFPTSGVVPAGSKHQVTVEFHSDNPGSFEEIVAIDISDRSPNDYLDVIEYRLVGESCVPGINTTDFASIFEEQTVCKRLELFNTQANVYAEEDRVFYFGSFLAGQQAQVRFKISNPYKIPCDVSLSTKPRSRTKSDAADFAFDVEPKKLSIPSHEYRYVVISFHPTSIQTYAGIFEAIVENVDQTRSKTLTFELRGEGTLPRVTIDKPQLKNKAGLPLLKFKKLLLGASQTLPIVLRNEGTIPAKVRLDWGYREIDEFECSGINSYHNLKPQESKAINVTCRAISVKKIESELRVRVIDNSFEDSVIQLTGESYIDEVTFANLPNDAENELLLTDCFVGETKHVTFTVSNHSSEIVRLAWVSDSSEFIFSPSVAHLRPQGQKDFTVSFCAKQPVELNNIKVLCKLTKIKYLNPSMDGDWDDKAKAIRWLVNDNKASAPRKVIEPYPEPQHETLPTSIPEHFLLVTAFADFCSYECDTSLIKFKSTLMYQTRVYRFNVRNSGKVPLKYAFLFCDEDGQYVEQDECPFSVVPAQGSIDPGENLIVTMRFSPQEDGAYSHTLVCHMQNLAKDCKPLAIKVLGTSLRPFCHFELEESDYITSERRNPDLGNFNGVPTVLPPNTKVIEFGSCGVRVRNTKRFYIVNPTDIAYEFEWTSESFLDQRVFRCLTPKGMVLPNKKFEVIFEFTPETVDLKALEPNVYMDKVSLNFKSLLVGRQVKETVRLINSESIPFAFNFNETSFELGNDGTPVLRFSPTSGTIGGRSEIPIEIIFCPCAEKTFNFNLLCNVKKKPTPVSINVKGEGYEIHESLQSELSDGTVFELASGSNADNTVEFGQVQINEKRLKRVTIINSGKFNFDFQWKFLSKTSGAITISPELGTVPRGERVICEITFMPTQNINLKNIKAICQIVNGRTYPMSITGSGCRPLLKFSSVSHDFGTQFVYKSGTTAASTRVKLTNNDIKEITFDIPSQEGSVFDIQRNVSVLLPGESTELEIFFYPREARAYSETVQVEVNGLSTVDFTLMGVGADFRVDLSQSDIKNINFGAMRVGHVVTKTVKVVNRSVIPATFAIGPPASIEGLSHHSVSITPVGECTLRPKGTLNLELKFQPQSRIPPFSEEICLEAPGISKPLFLVSGACQGIEIKLENDTLPFGAVVQKSCTSRRIQLQNAGDIGATFHWDVSKFSPDFSISPSEGYISPGMDLPLEITFHPTEINQDIRYESLACAIEGSSPLYLTLTGMCIPQPLQSDILKFSAPVRQTDVKGIKIENKTSMLWHIRPIIENEFWSGPETFDVEAGQVKTYDLTFMPLEMMGSGDGGRHEGSIFFPLPDGFGLLYKLYGMSDKPLSAGTITREVPCKTSYTEILAVNNWLKRPQRFKVIIEVAKPDASVILKGLDFIDVPPLLTREYKLNFYSYKEGVTNAKIIFKNEQTQEFSFYNLAFKSTPPGVISTMEMSTTVRQLCSKEVTISNPLAIPVTFNAVCSNPDVSVTHSFSIQPKSESTCLIEYLPLQAKDTNARLTISSAELGIYQYDLKLVATPAGLERSLHFKVGLGGSQTQTFRFLNYAKTSSYGGVEVSIDVTYEPSKLGDTRTQLLVTSSTGGDYICPLYGHCIPPRPQGPITIKMGSSATVPFKNVFAHPATFNFVVDNPAFSVKATESIGAKKVVSMVITAHAPTPNAGEPKGVKVGKLTVTHKGGSNVSWVYYLRTG
ncbi:hypothetical protein HDV05_000542 [Chytridiales sp. JEL 0842]|nr:hypothetical protein HDV05_000542 [Chytridiales sp. JEL 0842]